MSKTTLSRNDFQAFWSVSIRYYELDPQGVVHNANYVSFFDEAITGYFKYVNYDYWTDIEDILGKMLSSVMLSISSATLPARSVTLALIDCMIFDVLSRRV